MANIIALVGRPNVGKSTLFNRLTESRDAIVDQVSGVTRDRHYGKSDWNGISFSVIDTGGYIKNSDDVFEKEIQRQVELAVEEAEIILFLTDTQEGINMLDEEVAQMLRKSKKPVFLVANKVDDNMHIPLISDFYSLGIKQVFGISSINGSGTGELLDEVVKHFEDQPVEEIPDLPRFTVVGRPNVGKSSLINVLLDDNKHIVTDIAGTTRDSIFTRYQRFGFDFFLVDTAGLRRKTKVNEDIEFYSVMRSVRAIENSDVCILMIDATDGFEAQDLNIFSLIVRNNKGVVIVVNKWDLIEKSTLTHKEFEEKIRAKTAPFTDIPIIFTSVPEKQRVIKAIELAVEVYKNRKQRISTSKLNDLLLPFLHDNPPPAYKGKYINVKYITQLPKDTPMFVFFCNLPQYIRESYKRFVENKMREFYQFTGVPIHLFFRKK